MKRVAIMQPTFLPWTGYLGMMRLADVFVFYDDVQFSKQSWQNRNRIKMHSGEAAWLTVPTRRKGLDTPIHEVELGDDRTWQRKQLATIQQTYSKSAHFDWVFPVVEAAYGRGHGLLADFTIDLVTALYRLIFSEDANTVRSSQIDVRNEDRVERLVDIVKSCEGDEYLSPIGSRDYLDPARMAAKGLSVSWYSFPPKEYPQEGDSFLPYMSVIDLLCHVGPDAGAFICDGLEESVSA